MSLADSSLVVPFVAPRVAPKILGLPLLGSLPQLLREHHGALDDWFERGGDFFRVSIAGVEVKMIARGKIAAQALNGHRNSFVRSPVFNEGVRVVTGDSLLTRDGADWQARRRTLQPHFRAKVMRQMVARIGTVLDGVIDALEPGRIELSSLCDTLAMHVGLEVMFGHSMGTQLLEELRTLSPVVIARVAVGWVSVKLPKWLPLPGEARFRRAMNRIDEIVLDMVKERRASGDFGDDLLASLLHMADEGVLDDRGIRDEAVTMLLAGYETTSNTLGWTLHTLAEHPEIAAKVRAEAEEVFGGSGDVRELEYSLRCFKEGLRLHPAALWVMRQATEDVELDEFHIAAGETVLCSTHLIHRNPADWKQPDRFDPDRFAVAPPRHAWVPFGIGPMMCIGKHLALLEGQLLISKLLYRWELAPVSDHTPRKVISTTLSNADGIYAELRPVHAPTE